MYVYVINSKFQLQIVQRSRDAFATGKTRDVDFRLRQMQSLLRMYEENENDMVTALYKDLRKPKHESLLCEVEYLKNDVRALIANCKEWSKPQRVGTECFTLELCIYLVDISLAYILIQETLAFKSFNLL